MNSNFNLPPGVSVNDIEAAQEDPMTLEDFWEEHNKRLNTIIGKLSVPAMQTKHPMVVECHRELIDFAGWVDESLEVIESEE